MSSEFQDSAVDRGTEVPAAIASGRQKRLRQKYEQLQNEWDLYTEIMGRLQNNLIGMPEGLPKIQLEKELEAQKCQRKRLEEELDRLESELESEIE